MDEMENVAAVLHAYARQYVTDILDRRPVHAGMVLWAAETLVCAGIEGAPLGFGRRLRRNAAHDDARRRVRDAGHDAALRAIGSHELGDEWVAAARAFRLCAAVLAEG